MRTAVKKMKTFCFVLGVVFIQQTYAQDCLQPTVSNGNFVGDTAQGGTAAVLCHSGYTGGGPATCSGGVWTVLPGCTAKNCGTTTVANGVLLGDTFYGGTAFVNCNAGYEGGGTAICGTGGSWTTVPGCTAVDCGVAPINHGSNVGDTTYGGSPFVVCDTGYTGGGGGLTCLQTGAWDIQVSCNPRSCGTPTVTNGVLSGDNFYTGTASIVCNAGYQGGGTATCQSNGQWATLPTCIAKDCGTPTISHGSLSTASSTLFAGSAVVECDSGYTGGGTVVCLNTGNWGTIPACNPVDCGTPTVTNGALTGSTAYSGSATVTCNSGYEGGGAATCQANGNWATLPACTPVDCETPTIANGKLSAGSNTYYGGTATAECNTGYLGGGSVTCLSSGTWTANPSPCTPVDCGTPTIQRGTFSGDTFYTGSASVVCNSGYESSGTAAVCSAGGTWTLPTCTAINCGTLNVANGVFTGDTFYGGSALVTCNNGYVGSGTATCGSSGTWIVAPTCNARDCGDPGIPHSTLIGSTLYNEGAFITCNAGYSGGGTATCLAIGVWQPPLPTCTPKDCGTPTITNGALSADSSTLYDGTATVVCNSGYEGGGTATCQTSATWATLPTCSPVDCGSPNIPNGFLTTGSSTKYAGSAIANCDSGYELAGTNVATCLADGTWDTLPVCNPKDCGPLPDPTHGSVSYTTTTYQSIATYTCESLWQLSGSATRTCEADGNWSPVPPTCADIDCPALTAPTNGAITTTAVSVGTTVIVSCDSSYTLFGDEVFQCETGGTWNVSEMGTCRKDCPLLTAPAFSLLSTGDVFEGAVVTITCLTAYTLEGASQVTCQPGGNWDYSLPVCTEDCDPLAVPDHGSISTNVVSQGTVVIVSCDTGYTLFGANTLTCRTDASWNNPTPTCELDCPVLSPPQNGIINNYSTRKFTMVLFSCNTGYTLFGQSILSCQDDSTWDSQAPVCLKDCPTLTYPANGILSDLDPRQETVTIASCFSGYTLFGAANLTCQSDATWDFPMPECKKNCPALIPPTNGAIDTNAVSQETEVNVTCSDDYTLFGASTLLCQSDASWDYPMPNCLLDCPALSLPANGYINNTVIRSQGTAVGVFCNNMYTLFGASVLTCQSDANWDYALPECKKDCPILLPPSNGTLNTTTESQGTIVGVTCDTGYTLFGDDILQCQNDALWDREVPVCKKDCRSLIVPASGAMDNTGVSQDTIVSFTCDVDYTLFGSSVLICESDAMWNSTEPTCEKDCPTLNIMHSSISTTVVIMNTVVSITCDDNYSLEGAPQLTCVSGGVWNYPVPECTQDCSTLTPPTNGYLDSMAVSQGSRVRVFCDFNYTAFGSDNTLFGDKVLTCQDNALWDLAVPTCRIDCPPMYVPANAMFSTMDRNEGIVVVVSCLNGFTRFGNQNITCLPGGFWDKSLPTCRKDCGLPDDLENGMYILETDTLTDGVVTYSCMDGYVLIGNRNATCLITGLWETPPYCRIISIAYNESCHVTEQCETQRSTCRSDGLGHIKCLCEDDVEIYNPETDTCLAYCDFLTAPTNGYIVLPSVPSEGQIVSYSCDVGYDLNDVTYRVRTCLATRQWSGTAPLCISACPLPIPPPHGSYVTPEGTAEGKFVYYSCDTTYSLVGDTFRECMEDTSWSGNTPTCLKDCEILGNIENGLVDLSDGNWDGSVATYYCAKDYALIGTATRTCEGDSGWSGTPPECIYAIFPDVLLVIASLLIFLVIVDIFVVLAILYKKYKKQKEDKPGQVVFDDLDGPNIERSEVSPGKHPDAAVPFLNFSNNGPGRSSFRKPENIQITSETDEMKNIPQLPKKKKTLLHRIPKPKPLKKLKRPKFFSTDKSLASKTIPNSDLDEFADEKMAEMERYIKDDFGTPSSSANRRSTADEEKVSVEQIPSSRFIAGDNMVLMDFDDAQNDDLPTTRLEEPQRAGPSRDIRRDRLSLRDGKTMQSTEDPPDILRPHTPIFPH